MRAPSSTKVVAKAAKAILTLYWQITYSCNMLFSHPTPCMCSSIGVHTESVSSGMSSDNDL